MLNMGTSPRVQTRYFQRNRRNEEKGSNSAMFANVGIAKEVVVFCAMAKSKGRNQHEIRGAAGHARSHDFENAEFMTLTSASRYFGDPFLIS